MPFQVITPILITYVLYKRSKITECFVWALHSSAITPVLKENCKLNEILIQNAMHAAFYYYYMNNSRYM